VRVHDRLLKLEARVDLLLKRTADESGGGEASSAAAAAVSAAAAATKAASAEAAEEAASIAEAAAARDITWRVRDAVESTFAQGWEARRSGGGGVSGGVVKAASASARPQSAPAAVAAAAATPTLTPTAPPAPPPSASSFTPLPPSTAIATTSVITVEFVVRCQDASYGERVWISGGGAAALGSWRPERALRLRWAEGGRWCAVAEVEVAEAGAAELEFKAFLRRDDAAPGERGRWEGAELNHKVVLGQGEGGEDVTVPSACEGVEVTVLEAEGGGRSSVRVEFEARF
jgi:hypothetical protein